MADDSASSKGVSRGGNGAKGSGSGSSKSGGGNKSGVGGGGGGGGGATGSKGSSTGAKVGSNSGSNASGNYGGSKNSGSGTSGGAGNRNSGTGSRGPTGPKGEARSSPAGLKSSSGSSAKGSASQPAPRSGQSGTLSPTSGSRFGSNPAASMGAQADMRSKAYAKSIDEKARAAGFGDNFPNIGFAPARQSIKVIDPRANMAPGRYPAAPIQQQGLIPRDPSFAGRAEAARKPMNTVQPGSSWTNPAGVPDSVKNLLAKNGYAPDGTRLPTAPIAQDPAIRGLNQQAQRNYRTVSSGPFASRVYSDPDLAQPSPANGGFIDSIVNAFTGGGPASPAPSPVVMDPSITGRAQQAPSIQSGSILGMQPTGPGLQQIIADGMTRLNRLPDGGFGVSGALPGAMGPRAGTAPIGNMPRVEPSFEKTSALAGPMDMATAGTLGMTASLDKPTAKITDRVPASGPTGPIAQDPAIGGMNQRAMASRMPAATGEESVGGVTIGTGYSFPGFNSASDAQAQAIDRALINSVSEAYARQPTPGSDDALSAYPGADGITQADIAGGFADPGQVVGEKVHTVRRGETLSQIAAKNGTTVQVLAEANGIKNVNRIREGQTLLVPAGASVQPMGVQDLGEPEMATKNLGIVQFSNLANPVGGRPLFGRGDMNYRDLDRFGNLQDGSTQSGSASISPAAEVVSPGAGEATASPSQDDGQPQSLREVYNRYQYEKQRAKDGFKNLPEQMYQAIVNGEFTNPNGAGNFPQDRSSGDNMADMRPPSLPLAPTTDANTANLTRLLLALLQAQQGQADQASLVFNTYV